MLERLKEEMPGYTVRIGPKALPRFGFDLKTDWTVLITASHHEPVRNFVCEA